MNVAGLLLAAGAGRRFGRPKALVEWDGEPLVARGLRTLAAGGTDPALVVLGAASQQVRALAGLHDDQVVAADGWAEGVGASLRAGLAALAETTADAVVVMLVDQPLVGATAVRRLVDAIADGPGNTGPGGGGGDDSGDGAGDVDAVVATYCGRRGHPVAIRRAVWQDVAALAVGDVGARAWLSTHPGRVREVACDGTGIPADIDTQADLARLEALSFDEAFLRRQQPPQW